MRPKALTSNERAALVSFGTLSISVREFLSRLKRQVRPSELEPGSRHIRVLPMPDQTVNVNSNDVRFVVQRYLSDEISAEELSNWAGLILAIPAYILPTRDSDDALLELLTDLALPLDASYFDRDVLSERLLTLVENVP